VLYQNIPIGDILVLGFCGPSVFRWRPILSSLFPEFYDHALETLVRARKAARLTQESLAEAVGRPQSFVAKYEGRERRLDVAEFVAIARTIGVDPYALLRAAEKDST
jgi:helix-turn-helix protein